MRELELNWKDFINKEIINSIPITNEKWIWGKRLSFERVEVKDTDLVSKMIKDAGWEFRERYRDHTHFLDYYEIPINKTYIRFLNTKEVFSGIFTISTNIDFVLQLNSSKRNIIRSINIL